MTTSHAIPTKSIPASEVAVGMHVLVSSSLATYHGQPDLAGTVHVVTAVHAYSPRCIGITLAGLPETCATPLSAIALVLR